MNLPEHEMGLTEGLIDPLPQAVHFNVDLIDRSLKELNELIKSAKHWFEDDNQFIRQNQEKMQECIDQLSKEVDATFDESSMQQYITKDGQIASLRIFITGGITAVFLFFIVYPVLDQTFSQSAWMNALKGGTLLFVIGHTANNYMIIAHDTHKQLGNLKETRLDKIKENKKEIMQGFGDLVDKITSNRRSNGEMMVRILDKIGSSNENLAKLIPPMATAIAARQIVANNSTAIKQLRENVVEKLSDNLG